MSEQGASHCDQDRLKAVLHIIETREPEDEAVRKLKMDEVFEAFRIARDTEAARKLSEDQVALEQACIAAGIPVVGSIVERPE